MILAASAACSAVVTWTSTNFALSAAAAAAFAAAEFFRAATKTSLGALDGDSDPIREEIFSSHSRRSAECAE
jgi:hypothetical protein